MNANNSRLIAIVVLLASALCGSHACQAVAQETGSSLPGNVCPLAADLKEALNAPHWNGWGADLAQHRFQPAAMAQLAAEDVPRLKLKWAVGFSDVTRMPAQPAVVGGRIFVGSQTGRIYALDARSGCTYWHYEAGGPVRSAITIGQNSGGWSAYFGDGHAVVYALDALSGKPRWTTRADDHPAAIITGAPTLVGTTLFVPVASFEEVTGANPRYACCTFRGSIVALDAATGKLLWKNYTITEKPTARAANSAGVQLKGPSGASVWSSPTYDTQTTSFLG